MRNHLPKFHNPKIPKFQISLASLKENVFGVSGMHHRIFKPLFNQQSQIDNHNSYNRTSFFVCGV